METKQNDWLKIEKLIRSNKRDEVRKIFNTFEDCREAYRKVPSRTTRFFLFPANVNKDLIELFLINRMSELVSNWDESYSLCSILFATQKPKQRELFRALALATKDEEKYSVLNNMQKRDVPKNEVINLISRAKTAVEITQYFKLMVCPETYNAAVKQLILEPRDARDLSGALKIDSKSSLDYVLTSMFLGHFTSFEIGMEILDLSDVGQNNGLSLLAIETLRKLAKTRQERFRLYNRVRPNIPIHYEILKDLLDCPE